MYPRFILQIVAVGALLMTAVNDALAGNMGNTAVALLAIAALTL